MSKIIAVYVNDECIDKYTVYLTGKNRVNGLYECLCLNDAPEHPLGFSQFSMGELGEHNGRGISVDDLPLNVQAHIEKRLDS